MKIYAAKYHFFHFSVLIVLIAIFQHFTQHPSFTFIFHKMNFESFFWKIALVLVLCSLLNGIFYLLCFRFGKIRSITLYTVHAWMFSINVIILLACVWFACNGHYFRKYYAYDEFYKIGVKNYLDISISLSIVLMALTQLLLPVNFVWSLLSEQQIKQI